MPESVLRGGVGLALLLDAELTQGAADVDKQATQEGE